MKPLVSTQLPTEFGPFEVHAFDSGSVNQPHLMLCSKKKAAKHPLVRVHSECWTGDVVGSLRCDCGPQLHAALDAIVAKGWGVLLYLRQEGRGIGLHAKIQAYHLQDEGADTMDANLMLGLPADGRDYAIAAQMLTSLGVSKVNLLTNNPEKVAQLEQHGIDIALRTPLIVGVNENNRDYLATKGERMGHHIKDDDL